MSKRRVKPTKGLGSVCSDPPSPYCKLSNCRFSWDRIYDQSSQELQRRLEQACKKTGVPGLLFHDVRRTAVRNMIRAGVSEKTTMQISGHKTASILLRYSVGRNWNPHPRCAENHF